MLLGDKLYIGHKILADVKKPFIIVDKNTLKPVGEEEVKYDAPEGQNQSLLWTDVDEKGRSLTYTPLITDGKLIYVISRCTPPEDEAAAEKKGYTQLVVEVYDPQQGYKFIRMLTLMKKNQANPFRKKDNTVEFL